jgi:hypothetical protein
VSISEKIDKYFQASENIVCEFIPQQKGIKIQLKLKKKPKISKIINLLHILYKIAISSSSETFLSSGQVMNLDSTVKSTKDALHILHEMTAFAKDTSPVVLNVLISESCGACHLAVDTKLKRDGEILVINFESRITPLDFISFVSKALSTFNAGRIVDDSIPIKKFELLFNTNKGSKIYQLNIEMEVPEALV